MSVFHAGLLPEFLPPVINVNIFKEHEMRRIKVLLLLCVLAVAGCNVYMSPEYQQTVADAADAINGLNVNCQNGDPNACEKGLDLAKDTINMILEASYGR